MSVLLGVQRLIQRARLAPWRVERILEETAGLREDISRLRSDLDAANQVMGDSLALLTRSVDELAERIASFEAHLGSAAS